MNFILGYETEESTLNVYKSKEDADFNSEEWCVVSAESLEEAMSNYEATFLNLKRGGEINGCL